MTGAATLLPTIVLVLSVWVLLAVAGTLTPWLGLPLASALAFGAAAALTALVASPPERRVSSRGVALAFAAGLCLHAPVGWGILTFGLWLGLSVPDLGAAPLESPTLLLSIGVLAPVFEELLYRRHLLGALSARLGAPTALVLSSLAFALPHATPWPILGSFLVGLGLGAAYLRGRSVRVCIAIHVGLNAAGLLAPWAAEVLGP